MFTIDFEPVGRRGQFTNEQSLLECARQLSVELVSLCGGMGSCEHCKVQVISGQVSPLTLEEESSLSENEIKQGYRMACMTYPESDVKLHVPPDSLTAPQRTQVEGLEVDVEPDPLVRGLDVQLTVPTLETPQADSQNIWQALAKHDIPAGQIDLYVQQTLSQVIRENNWQVRVALREDEIVAVGPPFTRWLGLAVDVGTTKVAGYLLEMETGHTLASKGMMNPQISYGEDVVSRIVAASKSSADAHKLQSLLVDAINQLTADLCAEGDAKQKEIVDAVIVGNTAIHHLFLGLPVRQLGLSPYIPAVDDAVDLKARDLGVHIAQGAYIHLLPNIAGYVGADHVSMMLATRLEEAKEITLAIDIGTNTEICLNYSGKLTSVSCASGPAFEGAHIKFGMRAAPGAIEHVRLDNNQLEIQTIGNEPAVGICGSGLLDVVAQLRENDIVDRSGKMGEHPRIQRQTGKSEFILAERDGLDPVTISQKDVRELQLAKAAIRLGIQALVDGAGLQEKDIERVIIAGAFGTFIDVKSAITIGMLPDLPLERFTQVGNAAGTGARLALVSKTERQRAKQIAIRDGYIELAKVPDFSRKFARATYF
ncbi:MAG: ASKHA domain-containing protein [Anaerolineales bacterium]